MPVFAFAGISRKGKTVREAREKTEQYIHEQLKLLEQDYSPYLVAIGGVQAFVFCDKGDWTYALPHTIDGALHGIVYGAGNSREERIKDAQSHCAELAYLGDPETIIPLALQLPPSLREDFVDNCAWQIAYNEALLLGLLGNTAHEAACQMRAKYAKPYLEQLP